MSKNESKSAALVRIFIGANGLRPIWRFVAFVAAVFALFYVFEGPASEYLAGKLRINLNLLSPQALVLSQVLDLVLVLIVVGAAAAFEHRRIDTYGLPLESAFGRKFWEGMAMGFTTIAFVALGMIATGGMRVHGIALHGRDAILSPMFWLITMLFVGVNEEYLSRGYGLQSLARGIGFWPASIVTTSLFSGAHLTKPHENAIDIGMIFALGMLLCFTLARTGNCGSR
jgi:membrane protease YdiL (CAAX protease family)